ncbi:hypothetical protein M5X06_00045 [Paenibacillus alvei]|uniref:Flp pilus assembly protein TadB n=1 Tax=Paenibacillus alvei TaxID=44250 RepID=A0ABT4GW02_PAEAL|nr:hypothetical protein [Paenibacillus alvei]MCY9760611.1 hypothetical protein [Paenibacillus alvei]MCY9765225.1 hypothetical protein [Paenibacillus alvei]
MMPSILPTIIVIILILIAVLISILVFIQNRINTTDYQESLRIKALLPQRNKEKRWDHHAARLYPYLLKIPLLRRVVLAIRSRLMIIHAGDESMVRIRTSKITLMVVGSMTAVTLTTLLWTTYWPTRLSIILTALYIGGFMSDILISRIQKQMLRGQSEMILNIRHEYHQTYMVNKSLEQSAERCVPITAVHAKKVADILNAVDPEEELNLYYDVAPNRYMKQLAAISYKVAELGDSNIANGEESIYLSALTDIRQQIHMDINRREQLDRKLSGIVFVAASPIFLLDPIRNWSESMFPIISNFYNSSWGLYSLVLLYMTFIFTFVSMRYIKGLDGDTQAVKEEGKLLNKLLRKRWIKKLILRVAPQEHEAAYFKTTERIKNANSKLSVESFYLKKVITATLVFMITILAQFSIHGQVKHNIIYPNKQITTGGNQESSQILLSEERYRFESLLIGEILDKEIQPDEMLPFILDKFEGKNFLPTNIDRDAYAMQLLGRVAAYQNEYFKWYELVIAIIIAAASYRIPEGFLLIRHQFRKWEMQNEVDGFYTNVMMLARFPGINVYEIVEWLHRYSYIFQDQLLKCLLDYEAGAWDALERLKDDVHFVPLERLADRLQAAAELIPVKNAFDDMYVEREFAMDQRKEHNEKTINNKEVLGTMIGWLPMHATLLLYLGFPFGYLAFEQLGDLTIITSNL